MLRVPCSFDELKKILARHGNIIISEHYMKYLFEGKRDIKPEEIKEYLGNRDFYFVEKQLNSWTRYKVIYELSKRYDLIIVVKPEEPNILKVVSAYKSNKKLKEKWKKMLKSRMMK